VVRQGEGTNWLRDLAAALAPGQPVHELLYAGAIIFFCFFYTAAVQPKETAENLKKSGAFIRATAPATRRRSTSRRSACASRCWVALPRRRVLHPEFPDRLKNVPFYFGGTSLLIIVVVTMDFMTQVQRT